MYKNFIFDLYGTLVDIETDEEKESLWEKTARMYRYKQAEYTGAELRKAYIQYVEEEKADAEAELEDARIELADAYKELTDADKEIADAKKELEEQADNFNDIYQY